MSDSRNIEDQLKMTDADAETSTADRTESGLNTGSATQDANLGVLDDVAHPFDQTNGILDQFDETHPGNVTGESASEYAASATPEGAETPPARSDADDSYIDEGDTPVVPPPLSPTGR